MARTHARIYTSIWADRDFRNLTKDAQRLYILLITQPSINHCGVLPYVPRRWLRLAPDETERTYQHALAQLVNSEYILLDENTDELLIRTFIKHDRIAEQEQIHASARRQYQEIESHEIRRLLRGLYPSLFDGLPTEDEDPVDEPLFDPTAQESTEGSANRSPKGSGVGVSQEVKGGLSRGHARTPTSPTPKPAPTPNPLVTEDPELYVARETDFASEPTDDAPGPEANSTGFSINPDTLRSLP